MQLNHAQRELTVKIGYYGPGLSGKTTNLQWVHQRTQPDVRGRLLTVETHDDRTLFFDLLPVFFSTSNGFKVKVKLFTVPGQVIHNTTRKVVLQGCDGVAFVADSQVAETKNNNESFKNLSQNLKENRLDKENIPIVIQFNKRDLPKVRTDEEIKRLAQKGKEPVFPAIAFKGDGVVETFLGLAAATWESLEKRMGLGSKHGIPQKELLDSLGKQLGADVAKINVGGIR